MHIWDWHKTVSIRKVFMVLLVIFWPFFSSSRRITLELIGLNVFFYWAPLWGPALNFCRLLQSLSSFCDAPALMRTRMVRSEEELHTPDFRWRGDSPTVRSTEYDHGRSWCVMKYLKKIKKIGKRWEMLASQIPHLPAWFLSLHLSSPFRSLMEGSGNGFPYYYAHRLSPFGLHQGGVDGGDAVDRAFSSPSPAASVGGEGAMNPLLFPQSAVAAAGGRAPAPAVEPVRRKRGRPRKYGPPMASSSVHLAPSASPAVSASLSFSPLSYSAKPSSSTSLTLGSSLPPPQAPRRRPQDEFLGEHVPFFLILRSSAGSMAAWIIQARYNEL